MKTIFLLLLPVALLAQSTTPPQSAPAKPQPGVTADPVVLTIGTEKITKSEYESLVATLPDQVRTQATGPNKRKVAEQVAEIKVMAQEARREKLDQTPAVKLLLQFEDENVLASVVYKDLEDKTKTDNVALHAYYDKHKGDFDQVTARHILVRMHGSAVPLREGQKDLTDAEALAKAQDLVQKLKAGADFAALAKTESDDTQTGASGGLLPPFTRGQMIPEFENAAFSLPVGKVSDPVKTQFGYHIILVDQHAAKSFEDVKADIEPEVAREAVDSLKAKTQVVIDDGYFGK